MYDMGTTEPLKLYLDDDTEPFKVAPPPLTFQFNTISLPDGPHRLRIEAPNGLAPPTIREIPFVVRNGVAITVSGLESSQTIAGQVQMVINAYAGNTEVDFEPHRAETPQPIPTWAWVVLLGVAAWALFYVLNPQVRGPAEASAATSNDAMLGERVFMDVCARCHGEDGKGQPPKVPPLRDSDIALAETPADLLVKVTASTPGSMMPEWGTRLTNEEIIAAVNHVRRSWGHDGSPILLSHARPPPPIAELQEEFTRALEAKDVSALYDCCIPTGGITPQLFRTDGIDARGRDAVAVAWQNFIEELERAGSEVRHISYPDDRYDYDPTTIDQDGSIVIGAGRIFVETRDRSGKQDRDKGRFLHVYQRHEGRWRLVFDFADIRMAIGCLPGAGERICPEPGEVPRPTNGTPPATTGPNPTVVPPTDTGPRPGPGPSAAPGPGQAAGVGYAQVQQIVRKLGKQARSAPHESFWEFPYKDFVGFSFPEDFGEEGMIQAVVPWSSKDSNLIRALRDGKGIVVRYPNGTTKVRNDIGRMPKGGPFLSDADIQTIAAWIDAGCPEVAGKPSALPRPAGAATPAPGGDNTSPPDPFAPGPTPGPAPGFPPAGGGDTTPAPGFPAPSGGGDAPPAPGFPAPSGGGDAPPAPGFPAPSGGGDAAPAPGFPAPSGFPPASDAGAAPPSPGFPAPSDAGAAPAPSAFPPPSDAGSPPAPAGFPPPDGTETPPAFPPPTAAGGAPGAPKVTGPVIGYAAVRALLARVPTNAPVRLGDVAYADLLKLSFRPPTGPGVIRLVVPGDPARSNLLRLLADGKGVAVTDDPDAADTTAIRRIDVAPLRGPDGGLAVGDVEQVRRWIAAGCPEAPVPAPVR